VASRRAVLAEVCTFALGARSARGGRFLVPPRRRTRFRILLRAAAMCAMLGASACEQRRDNREVPPVNRPAIEKVLEQHSQALMQRAGVVGVYQSAREDGTPAITVMVLDSTVAATIPRQLQGYPVEIEISGPIRPLEGGR